MQIVRNTLLSLDLADTLPRMLPVTANDAVRLRLTEARIRPTELGKALHISKQQASLMLSGKRGISLWHLDRIAGLLKTSVSDLFRDLPRQPFGAEYAELGRGGLTSYENPTVGEVQDKILSVCDEFVSVLREIVSEHMASTPAHRPPDPSGTGQSHRLPHRRKTG